MDGTHPVLGSNIQMSSKPMKVLSSESGETVLRGYGEDPRAMGHPDGSFAHYGISITHSGNEIESITLHLHDKGADIVYNK